MRNALRSMGVAVVFLSVLSGCDAVTGLADLVDLAGPSTVRVMLVNNGQFDVEGTLFYGDQQEAPNIVLTEFGEELDFTVPSGESNTFVRTCDDLQAIVIDDADLLILGDIGPETNSDVLRDGDDFSCGDTIVFTFDHSGILVDFDVTVSIDRR